MKEAPVDAHFMLRKLHSLTGLVPVGAFLCFHLFENSKSWRGEEYFNLHVVKAIEEMHLVWVAEVGFILLPILFHALYGVVIWWQGQSNLGRFPYVRNYMYWLQRATGIVAFAFIITHVYGTRYMSLTQPEVHANLFGHMVRTLSNPLQLAWYIVGVVASVVHFANGLWLMGITWGITVGPRAQRLSTAFCCAVGIVLLALGIPGLFGFRG